MKRLLLMLGIMLGIAFGAVGASPASAAVTCTDYHTLNPTYPTNYPNNGHMFVCFTGYDNNRVVSIIGAASQSGNADSGLIKNFPVNYFYFKNRSDAISYMQSNQPYSLNSQFANANSRCGNTAAVQVGTWTIASEIYDYCTLGGNQVLNGTTTNPNALQDTAAHESGHAFDFAWGIKYGNPKVPPSQSQGFKMQINGVNGGPTDRSDLFFLKLGNSGSGGAPPPTCNVFDSQKPSGLESDLGAKYAAAVCANQTVQPPFTGQTNDIITEEQLPYFYVNPPPAGGGTYAEELFAEEFAVVAGGTTHTALPLTDRVIGWTTCSSQVLYGLTSQNNPIVQPGAYCPPATLQQFKQ